MPVLVRLPASADVTLCLSWTQCTIDPSTGVKQGATESPLIFAKLMDTVLGR